MRTKALICAAGLIAAGAATCLAQGNVYSLNVVGYINADITNSSRLTLVNTPLTRPDLSGNYAITNIVDPGGTTLPDGTRVYTFTGGSFATATKSSITHTWGAAANTQLPNGSGYFILNSRTTNFTVTYVGEVPQGAINQNFGAGLTLVGSAVPRSGYLADLGAVAVNGNRVYRYDVPTQNFVTYTKSSITGQWPNTPPTSDPVKGPAIAVNEGFFFNNASAGTPTWSYNYTVPQ